MSLKRQQSEKTTEYLLPSLGRREQLLKLGHSVGMGALINKLESLILVSNQPTANVQRAILEVSSKGGRTGIHDSLESRTLKIEEISSIVNVQFQPALWMEIKLRPLFLVREPERSQIQAVVLLLPTQKLLTIY